MKRSEILLRWESTVSQNASQEANALDFARSLGVEVEPDPPAPMPDYIRLRGTHLVAIYPGGHSELVADLFAGLLPLTIAKHVIGVYNAERCKGGDEPELPATVIVDDSRSGEVLVRWQHPTGQTGGILAHLTGLDGREKALLVAAFRCYNAVRGDVRRGGP